MNKTKLKSQKEIIQIIRKLKQKNKKIVTFNGSFDLLHAGHIQAFQEAKQQGDALIILLNSDKSVKKYKGPRRPIIPEKNRAQMLASIEYIDYVVLFDEINSKRILSKIKPDVHCNGSDWGKNCVERKTVEDNGGKIYILKWKSNISTSSIIKKIIEVYSEPEIKAVFLDRDGTININKPEYLHKVEDFRFTPFAIRALQRLSKTDYKIIIVTNQSGIGRGYFKESDLKKLHQWMLDELTKKGVRIDKIYYCPHSPEDNCPCRKPKIGMLLQAVKDFNISLNKSWVIGDDERDIIMARNANVKSIKIGKRMSKELKLAPNFYVKNLLEAVKVIQNYDK